MVQKTIEGVGSQQGANTQATPAEGLDTTVAARIQPTVIETVPKSEVDRMVGKSLDSIQRHLSERDKLLAEATKDLEKARDERRAFEDELDRIARDKYGDEGDVLKKNVAETLRIKREREAIEREREAIKKEKAFLILGKMARELTKESGIPLEELETCTTAEQMEIKSLRYSITHPKAEVNTEPKTIAEETPTFTSGTSSGGISDDAFIKLYYEGKSNDHKRAQEILSKL